jgi:hypothetical protein
MFHLLWTGAGLAVLSGVRPLRSRRPDDCVWLFLGWAVIAAVVILAFADPLPARGSCHLTAVPYRQAHQVCVPVMPGPHGAP